MNQLKTIYKQMTQTQNPAADEALFMGLRRADEPYRTVMLKSIVASGRPGGTAELVRNFHSYPEHWQEILRPKAEKLHHGLRQVSDDSTTQARLNVLTIIKGSHYNRLADLVVTLLRDQFSEVAQTASDTLIELAVHQSRDLFGQSKKVFLQTTLNMAHRDQRILLSALDAAIRNYKLHRHQEPILAAMCLVPATVTEFWKNQLEAYHLVGKTVRSILTSTMIPELIPFTVSALGHPECRSAAIQSLTHQVRPQMIAALAQYVSSLKDERIRHHLTKLKQPRWLDPEITPPATITVDAQTALVDLVMALGASDEDKARYLGAICEQGTEISSLKALQALTTLPGESTLSAYRQAVGSSYEAVALWALKKLNTLEHSPQRQFLARQLKSPHTCVRDLARSELKKSLLNAYWKNFTRLPRKHQQLSRKTLYKIDSDLAHQQWSKQACMPHADQRMQAIRMAIVLEQVERCLERILILADDDDAKVRSMAMSALGDVPPQRVKEILPTLVRALKDNDMRVRANTIEVLEKLDLRKTSSAIKPFVKSSNNRLRANTIKALMNWETEGTKGELEKMANDSNRNHRRSALWVLKQTQHLLNLPKFLQEKLAETSHASSL